MATQFTTKQFADGSIAEAKIATSAVTTAKINNGAVINSKIDASAAIATSKLAEGGEFLQRDGSVVLTGDLDANSNTITNLGAPSGANDAARKGYVDGVAAGTIDFKDSCRLATTTDLNSNTSISGTVTYNNTGGTSGTGQITGTLSVSDTFTVDGVSLSSTDDGTRILLKDESGGAGADANGIWTTTISGTSLTLDRASDFDEDSEVTAGAYMFISEGTDNADSAYVLSTNDPITIGTGSGTSLTFIQFSGAGQITAGDGLTKTSNTLSLDLYATEVTAAGDASVANNPIYLDGTNGLNIMVDNSTIDLDSVNDYRLYVPNAGITETQLATSVAGNGLDGGGGTALSVDSDTVTGGDIVGVSVTANGVGFDVSNIDGDGITADGAGLLSLNTRKDQGTADGTATFSLNASPYVISGSTNTDRRTALILAANGQVLTETDAGGDYYVNGSTVTWDAGAGAYSGDVITAFYWT